MKTAGETWLTPKRLRAHGLLLAVALWGLYAWTIATTGLRDRNGNLKGTDFLHLYILGSLAAERRGADLYDMNVQAALVAQRVPDAMGIRYLPLYPPQVSIFFAPLARLSYRSALSVWWIFSVAIYGICGYTVWRACPNLRDHGGTVALLAGAFPAFFHLIAWGQTSAVALACFTLVYFWLRDRLEFVAGVALGCLIFKPQLGLAAAIVFTAIGAWKILAGAALSSAAQLSIGMFYYGTEPFRRWLSMLWNVRALLPTVEPPTVGATRFALFCPVVGNRAGGASPYGVRPGDPRPGNCGFIGLASKAEADRQYSVRGDSALPCVYAALAGDCRPLHARSAFRLGDGGFGVRDRPPVSGRYAEPGHANRIDRRDRTSLELRITARPAE
jgi:Glycosyltransferase family 87